MYKNSFSAKSYRDNAIVLRTCKFGEADRIITLLTQYNGIVRAIAKGIRKTKSKFGARLEPGMVVDVLFARGRNLDIISQVETLYAHTKLFVNNFHLYTIVNAMLEVTDKLNNDSPNINTSQEYALLLGALNALKNQVDDPILILDAYLLRSMSQAGWRPQFMYCINCGKPGPNFYLSIPLGGTVCDKCKMHNSLLLNLEIFEILDGLITSKWNKVRKSCSKVRSQAHLVVCNYVQYHMEKSIKSIKCIERL